MLFLHSSPWSLFATPSHSWPFWVSFALLTLLSAWTFPLMFPRTFPPLLSSPCSCFTSHFHHTHLLSWLGATISPVHTDPRPTASCCIVSFLGCHLFPFFHSLALKLTHICALYSNSFQCLRNNGYGSFAIPRVRVLEILDPVRERREKRDARIRFGKFQMAPAVCCLGPIYPSETL